MIWTQERLAYLAEVNKEKKIQRYFSIKKLVEDMVEEEIDKVVIDQWGNPTTSRNKLLD